MSGRHRRDPTPTVCDCHGREATHGDQHMYHYHRCGCDTCREGERRRHARAVLLANRGTPLYVPAAESVRHVEKLVAMGWTRAGIARSAGVSSEVVKSIHARSRVSTRTERKILAVPLVRGARKGCVHTRGTTLRIRALVANGWTYVAIADRVGCDPTFIRRAADETKQHVDKKLADRVATVYEELWDKTPPPDRATQARNRAARNGWLPPMGLDDDRLDDPAYTPTMPANKPHPARPNPANADTYTCRRCGNTQPGDKHTNLCPDCRTVTNHHERKTWAA